ncbi:alpha/beta fold hydrolase [Alkaliflexus imshenetskii]|uniref:alpha/beta fold hydrolase n=1 Tax=Alkaliflexus imshenetskii TaxID=286730 RepID=UPI00047B5469|nr:alpha/beta fold hydrolase [Alkaliflexus imshenetskii]
MELFGRETGKGERTVVIVHGLYGASDNWMSIASRLENSFRVLLPDLRNHGRSFHHPEHNYEVMAADLLHFISSRTSEKVVLLGHSMGGKVAMRLALEHPQMVEQLVVVDIAPKDYGRFTNYGEVTNDHELILKTLIALHPENFDSRTDMDEALKSQFKSKQLRQFLLKNVKRSADGKYQWQLNLETLLENLEEIMDGFSSMTTSARDLPTLFIRGDKSPYVRDEDVLPISRFFPKNQVVTIPDAGHWVHAEQQELFLKTLLYFIE